MEDRFNTCAIEPDMGARMRFKQAASSVHAFKNISLNSTISEGRERLNLGEPFDIIFVSERIPEREFKDFCLAAKEHKHGQDAAFVLLVGAGDNLDAKTAKAVLAGFDGCLMEPYSVEALVDIARLTAQVKTQLRQTREVQAICTLIKTLIRQIDRMAYIRSCQMDPGETLRNFKEHCRSIAEFDNARLAVYLEQAVGLFEKANPDETIGKRRRYRGVSRRVKKKMVKRLLQQEQQEFANAKKLRI